MKKTGNKKQLFRNQTMNPDANDEIAQHESMPNPNVFSINVDNCNKYDNSINQQKSSPFDTNLAPATTNYSMIKGSFVENIKDVE